MGEPVPRKGAGERSACSQGEGVGPAEKDMGRQIGVQNKEDPIQE